MQNFNKIIIPRQENDDDLNIQIKSREVNKVLKEENNKLTFILGKYNEILNQYQAKYGNELFLEIDKLLSKATDPNQPNTTNLTNAELTSLKKAALENISLIKEYAARDSKKSEQYDDIIKENTKLKENEEKMKKEIEELNEEVEKIKKEKDDLFKQVLSKTKKTSMEIINKTNNQKSPNFEIKDIPKDQSELLEKMEKLKSQAEYYQNLYNDIHQKFQGILQEKKTNNDELICLREENQNMYKEITNLQNQVKESELQLIQLEKEKDKNKFKTGKLELEKDMYKQENIQYKELYDEMEARKNSEINILMNQNGELRTEIANLKEKEKLNGETIANLKFENSQLKQENSTLKFDCDHLTQILQDSNIAVQNASEKERHIDSIIKTYKQKINDIQLEKEKLMTKSKMQENQISKLSNDYTNLLREKTQTFENMMNISKSKYEETIQIKNEEIANLKTELLSTKMEKDKYFSDYRLIKGEFDRINSNFQTENYNYISKFEESEKKLISQTTQYEEKISQLNIHIDKLESDNKIYREELKTLQSNDKLQQARLIKMTQNENMINSDYLKLKEQITFYSKENESVNKEKERLIALYEAKISHLKDEYDIKIITLENTINFQKKQLGMVESKAFDLIKKQENLTEKFKKEYYNTVEYYEGVIAYLTGRGGDNKGQALINEEAVE